MFRNDHGDDTNCVDQSGRDRIYSECNGKDQCTLSPTTEWFGFDPCHGTFKYINATYKCLCVGKPEPIQLQDSEFMQYFLLERLFKYCGFYMCHPKHVCVTLKVKCSELRICFVF